jgi:hypothetical protein
VKLIKIDVKLKEEFKKFEGTFEKDEVMNFLNFGLKTLLQFFSFLKYFYFFKCQKQ